MPFLFFLLMAARRLFSLKGVCLCSYYGGGLRTPFWEFGAFCVFWPFSPDIRAMWAGVPDFTVVRNILVGWSIFSGLSFPARQSLYGLVSFRWSRALWMIPPFVIQ